ncbi:MAG: magnesium transporter, partial [Bacteroidota bacterium]
MEEHEAIGVLRALPPQIAAEAFGSLQIGDAAALLKGAPPDLLDLVVDRLKPEQAAAILLTFDEEGREKLLEHLSESTKLKIHDLLEFPEDSAGRIMSTNFLALYSGTKVKDAVGKIRRLARSKAPVSYVYVRDGENHLGGVVNMRDLMLADGNATLETVMKTDVYSVDPFMEGGQLAHELSERRFFAVPVVDSEGHILGVVKAERLISGVQDEATRDIQMMVGVGATEKAFSPVGFSLRKRLPWLNVNLATAFLAASVVALFEDVIARITVLAVFLPVVAGQGGNAGAQSLAVVMRGLVMREIPDSKRWAVVLKETRIGVVNGVCIGAVTALIAWVWVGNPYLGVVIGGAMIVNLLVAGFSGAVIPIALKSLGLDPAQSSSIVLTTVTDVVGFFTFLSFALLLQDYLI